MRVFDVIKKIDWNDDENKKIGLQLMDDAEAYLMRVEEHIFGSNEIKAYCFMDASEKKEKIGELDRKRTAAHDKMLESFMPFLDLLREQSGIEESECKLDNRTQIADFVFGIVFEALGVEPTSHLEGNVRDELAEKLHRKEVSPERIRSAVKYTLSDYDKDTERLIIEYEFQGKIGPEQGYQLRYLNREGYDIKVGLKGYISGFRKARLMARLIEEGDEEGVLQLMEERNSD